MRLKRGSRIIVLSIALGTLLSGCEALVVAGALAASPVLIGYYDAKRERTQKYVQDVFDGRTAISRWRVNDPIDNNSACILDVAIERARFDVIREALKAGADPQKCERPGWFIHRLSGLTSNNLPQMREVLRGADFMKSYPKSILVEEGIQSGNTALIQLGLDLGVSVNDPITAPRIYAHRVPAGSTPLYMAVYEYEWWKKSSLEALRFVIAAGARYDPSVEPLVQSRKPHLGAKEFEALTQTLALAPR
jgi:hypothetical protein